MDNKMFCFQCEQTAKGQGCTTVGVCGKTSEVANIQDRLTSLLIKLANLNERNEDNTKLLIEGLFTTITNVNFNGEDIEHKISQVLEKSGKADFDIQSVWSCEEDIRSLKSLILFGLKGMAAYAHHARVLGYHHEDVDNFLYNALITISNTDDKDKLLEYVLKTGEVNLKCMELLDKANTETYGNPVPVEVSTNIEKGPFIVVTGHDLRDLALLLEQTKDKGINVYTHGEMLPANYYPAFKKYDHFVGNYGNAWWKQTTEFESFNGPILMTTNCLVPPKDSYKDRVYTTGTVGFKGLKHINNKLDGTKDFSEIIEHAKKCASPTEIEKGEIIGGFAHNQVMQLSNKIVNAVKTGAIKHFFVMGGCDGRAKSRNYYTEFAEKLPKDAVILTAGCAKYKYNKLNLGDINGIPRVLDAGQCNDSYSLVVIALKLAEAFGLDSINDLPLHYNIAWYEQKAVIVLLSLLHLGVKNIHLGPTLPAFLSPNVVKVLVDNFGIGGITNVDDDMKMFLEA